MSKVSKALGSYIGKLVNKYYSPTNNADITRHLFNYLGSGSILYNEQNDDAYVDEGYRKNNTVYSIINLIARNASTVPFQVFEVKNKTKAAQYKSLSSVGYTESIVQSRIIKERAFQEVEDTDLHELLYRPNEQQSYNDFIQNIIGFGKLTGNRYIWGVSPETGPNAGKPQELIVLPSQHMEIISGGMAEPVKAYKLDYNPQNTKWFEAKDICHIKDFNPNWDTVGSQLYGQSPLMAAFRTLATNNEAIDTEKAMLMNQAARGLLVSKDMAGIDQDQAQQLNESLRSKMRDNRGGVAITPVPMEWINFGLTASDMSLLEALEATDKKLCQIYGVPSGLLGIGEATYENQKEWKKSLYQNAVMPELIKVRDRLNQWLVPHFGENLYLDFDFSVIPELQEDMERVVNQLSQAWWVTGNEKRVAMNYSPDKNEGMMNEYLVSQGLVPLKDLDLGEFMGDV